MSFALYLHFLHLRLELSQVDRIRMLTQKQIDHLLLVPILYILLIKPPKSLHPVIHDAHQVSLPSSRDISMGGSCSSIQTRYCIAAIGPYILKINDQLLGRGGFFVEGSHQRVVPEGLRYVYVH